jgi:hypothetical protein
LHRAADTGRIVASSCDERAIHVMLLVVRGGLGMAKDKKP